MLKVQLLGAFQISSGGKPLSLTSRAAQSLFAFLILNAGTAYRREKLAGQLWPDSTEESARDYLRHALWRIRKVLQEASAATYLKADDLTISFDASSSYWLDAAAIKEVSEHATADELGVALAAYKGELLPGFYDEWVVLERQHLQGIYEGKVDCLLALLQEGSRWDEILQWGEKWIALGQKPEAAYRYLMMGYAGRGDLSKVATTYERCAKSLSEYGVEPSEQTRLLYKELMAGKRSKVAQSAPIKLERLGEPFSNIPAPLTSFVGRLKEINEIVHLLSEKRLVSLTGSGGVGKTRLAIQVANKMRGKFQDGVCWVELAPISDPSLLPQAIALPLNVRESPNQGLLEALMAYFAAKKALLILDNCEHLIAACAQIAERLTGACPELKILATTREVLGIMGEESYEVPTLSVPGPQQPTPADRLLRYESIHLFVERARAVKSDFALTQANAAPVLQICQRLDGIPLALELAAARTKVLSVEHIAARLNDRFNLLTQGSRTALPRQQTLRATVNWSYDLLSQEARILFQRLSVFVGGFTLEAAEEICSDPPLSSGTMLDALGRLVDRSLVQVETRDNFKRYGMLETIREYSLEKCTESGETEQLRRQHRDYFIRLVERAEPKLRSTEQSEWLNQLEIDHDNLRAAWDCALETEPDLGLRLASGLVNFWHRRGNPNEGREWMAQLLPATHTWGPTARRAHALNIAGWLANTQQDIGAARELLQEALVIARATGDKQEIALALQWLGWVVALGQQEHQNAQALLQECLAIYQEIEDSWGTAMATFHLAWEAQFQGRYQEAEERGGDSLVKFRELGDTYWVGATLNNLGELSRTQGNYAQAAKYYQQFREIAQELRSRTGMAIASGNLAWVALQSGDYRRARTMFEESLTLSKECGNVGGATTCLGGFGAVLAMLGKRLQAAQVFGAAEGLFERKDRSGRRLDPVDKSEFEHYVSVVREQLDLAAFDQAWAKGRAMTLDQAAAFALKETRD